MEIRQDLLERFDYDLWANRQWWNALGKFNDLARAQATLEHILMAQRIWLSRVGVEINQANENIGLDDVMSFVNDAWKLVIGDTPLEQPIAYRNSMGFEFVNSVGQISTHVINHGTYHRGQLRGQAQAEGLESFPETDLIGFYREREARTMGD